MSPIRVEAPGALYHVFSRGNAQEEIFRDTIDYLTFQYKLAEAVTGFGWLLHAFCLLPNHYHLLLETPEANLGKGMLKLNGGYARRFNGRHRRVGHVFQGPYKAVVLARDEHLFELCRCIALNPVRAGLADAPAEWRWSSFAATAGVGDAPTFLTVDFVRSLFGGAAAFADFVQPGCNLVAASAEYRL